MVVVNLPLLCRLAQRESSAVQECIELYGGLVWSIARRLSKTQSDAEDVTQEIFLAIWQHASRFDATKGSELTFVATIARRRAIDRLRKSALDPITESSSDLLESLFASTEELEGPHPSWDADQAIHALAHLRPVHRQVLELAFLHGLTQSEIAARLPMPLGTVKTFMRRGLLQLRDYLNA